MLQHQALALRHFLGTVELKEPLKNVKVTDVLPPIRLTASRPDVTPFTVTQVSPTPIRPGGATRGPLTVVLSWGSNELVSGNEAVFDGDVKVCRAVCFVVGFEKGFPLTTSPSRPSLRPRPRPGSSTVEEHRLLPRGTCGSAR